MNHAADDHVPQVEGGGEGDPPHHGPVVVVAVSEEVQGVGAVEVVAANLPDDAEEDQDEGDPKEGDPEEGDPEEGDLEGGGDLEVGDPVQASEALNQEPPKGPADQMTIRSPARGPCNWSSL